MALQRYAGGIASIPKLGPDFAREVASRQQTEYLFNLGVWGEDEHPSEVIRLRSEPGDRVGEVYGRMLDMDATLGGLWEKRAKAVTGLPWSIIPGDESDEAKRIAESVTEMFYGIRKLETNLSHQLEMVAKGVAFDELRWDRPGTGPLAGLWTISELTDRPMWRFAFRDGVLNVRTKTGSFLPVPPGRILHGSHGTKDTPWGAGLLDKLWWAYFFTLHAAKYWGVALEKWAQPTAVGKYPRAGVGATGDTASQATIDTLLAAVRDFQTEYAIVIPDDAKIELIEAQRSSSIDYSSFISWLDRRKALVFLGEVDTSGMAQGPGSFAKSRVSNEVRYETILADACELSNSLTDGLIRPFVEVNFGREAPMPWWEFDVEEAEDRDQRQKGAAAIFDRGYPVPRQFFYRLHQVPEPRPGEATMRGPFIANTPAPPPAAGPPVKPPGAPVNNAAMAAWADQEFAA